MRRLLPNRQNEVNAEFAYLALVHPRALDDICHMDKLYPNRIRKIRDERGYTIEQLAELTGLSPSYVSRLEKGERNLSVRNLNLFSGALRVDRRTLLDESVENPNIVRVMGRIGAGAEITPEDEQAPEDGLYQIETPFPLPDDAIAFEVSGESMWPRYDPGDIIICWRQGISPSEVVGWEAAVETGDGRRYLKRVLNGASQGTYDLESHNATPIRGVQLVWVAAIQSVIRSGQWQKLSAPAKRNLKQKMLSLR